MKNLLVIILSLLVMTACRDEKTDKPSPDDSKPSTVDTKPYNYEQYMDKTVKPGDNFFMYCNGTSWNNTDLGGEDVCWFMLDIKKDFENKLEQLDCDPYKKFKHELNNIDKTSCASIALIKNNLKLVENISTTEQAHDAIVKTMLAGYEKVIVISAIFKGGKCVLSFSPLEKETVSFPWSKHCLTQLGFAEDDADNRIKTAESLHNKLIQNSSPVLSLQNIEENPEILKQVVPLNQTNATNSIVLNKVIQALGVAKENICLDSKMDNYFLELDKATPEEIQCLLQAHMVDDYKFTSNAAYQEYKNTNLNGYPFDKEIELRKGGSLNYVCARDFIKQYLSPAQKSKIVSLAEEIRVIFRSRIAQLDWMSQATKQKAIEKLDAMTFNIGYPDTWIESAFPSLNGASLLEDLLTMSRSNLTLIKEVAGKPSKETSCHLMFAGTPINTVNAFYYAPANSINIFPAWMMEPLHDENLSDAYNYAIYSMIGHEITHGFDNNGSKYNKYGDLENWWAPSDKAEFIARQSKLTDCYNSLELLPIELPGIFFNKPITLPENIADLGGFVLAYQAYNNKLQKDGYKDEELKKQQIKFFHAFANVYRAKYNAVHVTKWTTSNDRHSLAKERVNGVIMNIDQWYDLFDVKPGDLLYRSPDKRAYIW